MPPPYCAAQYGNLHRFPRPTALPAAAITNPILPVKLLLFSFIFPYFSLFKRASFEYDSFNKNHNIIYGLCQLQNPSEHSFLQIYSYFSLQMSFTQSF